jgi:hypothetical protein
MEITVQYLRERSALYRQKAAKATRLIDINRYRDTADLLDQQAAFFEKLATDGEPNRPSSNC